MKPLTRRSFFACSALSGLFGLPAAHAAEKAATAPAGDTYDAVILGAGTAGLVAAIRAADLGAKVVVLEKMDRPDGNTIYAMGTIFAWGTKHQKAANVEDNADDFFDDMMKVSSQRADRDLTRTYTNRIAEAVDWLQDDIGIKFGKPSENRARFHRIDGEGITGGGNLIKKLLAAAAKRNIPVLFEHKAIALLTNDKAEVTGVRVQTRDGQKVFNARGGVLIATGGFSANEEMTDRYIGGWASRLAIRGSRSVTGENVTLALPVFAKMVNMDQFHAGPIVAATHVNPNLVLNARRGIIVDLRGNRFIDEQESYVMKAKYCAERTIENKAYCIVDSNTAILARELPRYDKLNSPYGKGETLEELCKAVGLPYATVKANVDAFNEAVEKKTLGQLNPPNHYAEPAKIEKGPFYAIPYEGGMTATFGGPLIDTKARVKNLENRVIPGLYAAGNAAGGLFFRNYNGGSQLGASCVFGTLAAIDMTARAKANKAKA